MNQATFIPSAGLFILLSCFDWPIDLVSGDDLALDGSSAVAAAAADDEIETCAQELKQSLPARGKVQISAELIRLGQQLGSQLESGAGQTTSLSDLLASETFADKPGSSVATVAAIVSSLAGSQARKRLLLAECLSLSRALLIGPAIIGRPGSRCGTRLLGWIRPTSKQFKQLVGDDPELKRLLSYMEICRLIGQQQQLATEEEADDSDDED